MAWLFSVIAKTRKGLNIIEKTKGRWFWYLIVIGLIVFAVWGVSIQNYYFGIPFALLIIFGGLLNGMHSCRALLGFWFLIYAILLAGCYFGVMQGKSILQFEHSVLFEILLTVLLFIAWSFMIGVADHDVGTLAAKVVNTITTIAGILLSISVAFGVIGAQAFIWNTIQAAALYILLPFVIAGYAAALFKDIQIYWEKRYGSSIDEMKK